MPPTCHLASTPCSQHMPDQLMGRWLHWVLPYCLEMKTRKLEYLLGVPNKDAWDHQHANKDDNYRSGKGVYWLRKQFPEANLFHCSFHHQQNILKRFGGGLGQTPLTPLWMHTILIKYNSMSSIQFLRSKYESQMSMSHFHYLRELPDEQRTGLCDCL